MEKKFSLPWSTLWRNAHSFCSDFVKVVKASWGKSWAAKDSLKIAVIREFNLQFRHFLLPSTLLIKPPRNLYPETVLSFQSLKYVLHVPHNLGGQLKNFFLLLGNNHIWHFIIKSLKPSKFCCTFFLCRLLYFSNGCSSNFDALKFKTNSLHNPNWPILHVRSLPRPDTSESCIGDLTHTHTHTQNPEK